MRGEVSGDFVADADLTRRELKWQPFVERIEQPAGRRLAWHRGQRRGRLAPTGQLDLQDKGLLEAEPVFGPLDILARCWSVHGP